MSLYCRWRCLSSGMQCHAVSLKLTDVSEVLAVCINRAIAQNFWTDFHEISYWGVSLKFSFIFWFRSDKNNEGLHQDQHVPCVEVTVEGNVLWLMRLVAGLSPWRPGCAPWSFNVVFVVKKVVLGQISFLRVLRISPASIIPPGLHSYISSREWTIDPLVSAV
jgi:hypothetical protein